MTVRICMWSGPRNVSTALMRAFESRGDCAVVDEPLYAAFLHATGAEHLGRDEILASQSSDVDEVLQALRSPTHDLPLQFEKHMAHHWQPEWSLDALGEARHAFLIRDPAAVAASLAQVRGEPPDPMDLGTLQQAELLGSFSDRGSPPVVIDGDELRAAPEDLLPRLCARLDIAFLPSMLHWASGPRDTDGVWGRYWYERVWRSEGFEPADAHERDCPPELVSVVASLRADFDRIAPLRLRPSSDKESS